MKNKSLKLLIDNVNALLFNGARYEYNDLTLPLTIELLNNYEKGIDLNSASLKTKTIIGLKRGFQFIIDEIENELGFRDYLYINRLICDGSWRSGITRDQEVIIGETSHTPSSPNENLYWNIFQNFKESNQDINDIIDLFLNTIYEQFFNNGNKRTALLMMNYQLVKKDFGIFILNEKEMEEFIILLKEFYNNRNQNENKIKNYIKQKIKTPKIKKSLNI